MDLTCCRPLMLLLRLCIILAWRAAIARTQGEDYDREVIEVNVDDSSLSANDGDEKRLLNFIMNGYNNAVRPVRNSSTPVVVKLGLTLIQIFEMDEKNQNLVSNVWLDQEWGDEFLTWSPSDFNGIKMIRLPGKIIWRPDLVLYNSASDYNEEKVTPRAMVSNTGEVFWPVPNKLRSTCTIEVTYFPFDEQTCSLKYGSWTYDGFQVDVVKRKLDIEMSNYVRNGEWDITETAVLRNVAYYDCCPEPYPDVSFKIVIRRRTLYYLYQVIYPCLVMSCLSLLVFLLPSESGEKIGMGITVLLAFSVLMLSIAESLPETSESVPIISIYLSVVMSLSSVSVITTVLILNIHHRPSNTQPLPRWIRILLLRRRDKATILRQRWAKRKRSSLEDSIALKRRTELLAQEDSSEAEDDRMRVFSLRKSLETLVDKIHSSDLEEFDFSAGLPYGLQQSYLSMNEVELAHSGAASFNFVSNSPAVGADIRANTSTAQCNCALRSTQANGQTKNGRRDEPKCCCYEQNSYLRRSRKTASSSSSERSYSLARKNLKTSMQILDALKMIVKKHDLDSTREDILNEYQELARIVDRILFVFYGLATLAATLIILVYVPLNQQRNINETLSK